MSEYGATNASIAVISKAVDMLLARYGKIPDECRIRIWKTHVRHHNQIGLSVDQQLLVDISYPSAVTPPKFDSKAPLAASLVAEAEVTEVAKCIQKPCEKNLTGHIVDFCTRYRVKGKNPLSDTAFVASGRFWELHNSIQLVTARDDVTMFAREDWTS